MTAEKTKLTTHAKEITADLKELVLFNDDHNTFEFVIKCLIDVCRHDPEQAEQCALVTHLKGKCTINIGSWRELKQQHDQLTLLGLTVSIT